MKSKGQVALAVGAGYMLGRTHRMKMALMLAAAGATGRFPGGPRDLLERGGKMLAGSPEVAKLGETVRGELLNAAKAAAVTATSRRIDALSSRLQSGGADLVGGVDEAVGRKKSKRQRDEEPEDEYVDDEEYAEVEDEEPDEVEPDQDEAEEDGQEAPRSRKRPAARRRASTSGDSRPGRSRSSDDEDEDMAPTRARKTRAKATTDSAPVRRTRR